MALPSDNDMREAVAKADSDLQYVLEEAGASLATVYRVTAVHRTRRRFQAIADTRAEAQKAAKDDLGVDNATPEGRTQTASVVAAWELAKEYIVQRKLSLRPNPRFWDRKEYCKRRSAKPC